MIFCCSMSYNSIVFSVPVAQLDRVSDSDSEGCRFDPCRARHFYLETMMRRNDREVTDEQQILDVMDRCDSVYLAMQDPYCFVPYMVALSYGMEKNTEGIFLYFHSAIEGKKVDLLKLHPEVRFFMHQGHGVVYDEEKQSCTMNYESVSGIGLVEEVQGEQKIHGLNLLMKHYYPTHTPSYRKQVAAITKVYRMRILSMSAKKREKQV